MHQTSSKELPWWRGWGFTSIISGSLTFYVVFAATIFTVGSRRIIDQKRPDRGLTSAFAAWDGEWYAQIARSHYSYSEAEHLIAFFPAYPLVGRAFACATDFDYDLTLVLLSNGFFFAALIVLGLYITSGLPEPTAVRPLVLTQIALSFFPAGVFFHAAYTESMFLLLLLLTMYGIKRRWPMIAVAAIAGLATATRSVGVLLLVPIAIQLGRDYHVLERLKIRQIFSSSSNTDNGHRNGRSGWSTRRLFAWTPITAIFIGQMCLGSWGLLAFMAFQRAEFGDPFAFVKVQHYWHERDVASESFSTSAVKLLTLDPVRAVYDVHSPCYWGNKIPKIALVNWAFMTPILWGIVPVLIIWGKCRRWLSTEEFVLGLLLVIVPYVLQANRMCMASQARFASVDFPAFIVLGRMLSKVPLAIAIAFLCCSAFLFAAFTLEFTSWYPVY